MANKKLKVGQNVIVSMKDEHTFKGKIEGVIYLVSCDDVKGSLLQIPPEKLTKI